jgi:tRNA modification GTPase
MSVIYALSSGAGRAGVAVIRLSGAGSDAAVAALAGDVPPPRRASLRRLRSGDGSTLDHALVIWFPGPTSFTGEDCAELHLHGSRAVIGSVLHELSRLPDCRPAQAGEFLRRAFVNGRSDFIEIEALADLLDAETDAQRRFALRQLDGGLRSQIENWSAQATVLLAEVEAELDFSDEDDVAVSLDAMRSGAQALATSLRDAVDGAQRSEPMRHGFVVAIVGPPNAGKSSLLNRLAGHEAAIVSPIPGTTRDIVEARLDLGGWLVRVKDTAGIRETSDPIETLGVARALDAAREADMTLWLAMDEAPPDTLDCLALAGQRDRFASEPLPAWAAFGVSSVTGQGMDQLLKALESRAASRWRENGDLILATRQAHLIESAADQFLAVSLTREPELAAEALRAGRSLLAQVVGRLAASDVLDTVFGRFCIGK